MNAAEFPIEDFTSYELGKLLEVVVDQAAHFPEAPAFMVLRFAAQKSLLWDQARRDPFADPSFVARYTALRDLLEGHGVVAANEMRGSIEPLVDAAVARDDL